MINLQGLKLRETSITRIVEESVLDLLKPDSVRLTIISGIDDATVWSDHERLKKALVDLETNAVDAMPSGGQLTIHIGGNQDRVFLEIRDTGTGISQEHMDQLFTPFFTTKPIGEGTGLGLPSVYGVIKAHGGELAIESNADPGKGPTGTIVNISLPRRLVLCDPQASLIIHDD